MLAVRIKNVLLEECRFKFARTFYLIDSKVVICLINHESHIFHTNIGVRFGEIHEVSDYFEWVWVTCRDNIADTYSAIVEGLKPGGEWQNGTSFLTFPVSRWRVERPQLGLETLPEVKSNVHSNVSGRYTSLANWNF